MSFVKYLKDIQNEFESDLKNNKSESNIRNCQVSKLELIKSIIEQYSKTETKKWQHAFNYFLRDLPEETENK